MAKKQEDRYKPRKDGRYMTLVSTGKFLKNGKPERITVYAETSKKLEDKVSEMKFNLKHGTFAHDRNTTFRKYAEDWLKHNKDGLAINNYNNYANTVKNHIDNLEYLKLSDIKKSDVQVAMNKLNGHYGLQCRLKMTISQILETAIDDGLLYKNVAAKIRVPANTVPSNKRELYDTEKKAIKKCDFTLKEKAFVEIAYYTGLRKGEIFALTRNDINLKKNELSVSKSVSFASNNQPELKTPKTKSSNRVIPLPNALNKTLKEYIDTLDTLYLFTMPDGKIITYSASQQLWNRIFRKINNQLGGTDAIKVTDITPHFFRHNYATMLYYAGVDVKQAQKLLGHSNVKTTLEIYTHFMNSEVAKEKIVALSM